jgi:hypothetical protein
MLEMRHTLWCGEVNNVSISLEHVHFLNCLNGLNIELLQRRLELLIINA